MINCEPYRVFPVFESHRSQKDIKLKTEELYSKNKFSNQTQIYECDSLSIYIYIYTPTNLTTSILKLWNMSPLPTKIERISGMESVKGIGISESEIVVHSSYLEGENGCCRRRYKSCEKNSRRGFM